ncbi:MAG TPA: lipoyl domain-containing protein, partial [Solirubrobacterales bacterium]|nr:lipoyl domain-containing protein [Solirubrobacterales bacterium]
MSPAATGTVIPMPHMGVSVEEGTVIEWHRALGDAVAEGELICEIATDKVDTEVLSPAAGTITAILAAVDETIPVGAPLCELDGDASGDAGEGSPGAFGGVPGDPSPASPPGSSGPDSGTPAPGAAGADAAERAAGGRDEHGGFDPAAAADAVT